MAEEEKYTVAVDTKDAVKSIADLEKKVSELSENLKQCTIGSKEFAQTKKELEQYQTQLEGLNANSVALGDNLSKVGMGIVAGFQAGYGAMAAFGLESEEVGKSLQKMAALMSLSQGIKGILEAVKSFKILVTTIKAAVVAQKAVKAATVASTAATTASTTATGAATAAQWSWNAAIAANPIGALVTVITLLIAGLIALISWLADDTEETEAAAKAQEAYNKEIDKFVAKAEEYNTALSKVNKQHSQQIELLEAEGKADEEIYKARLKNMKDENKQRLDNWKSLKAEYDMKVATLLLEGKIRMENGQYIGDSETIQGIKKMQSAISETATAYNDAVHSIQVEETKWATKTRKEQEATLKEEETKKKQAATTAAAEAKRAADARKAEQQRAKDERVKIMEDEAKEVERITAEMEKANRTAQQNEIQDLTDKYQKELTLLEKYGQDTTALTEQYNKAVADVNKKYDDEQKTKQAEADAKALSDLQIDTYLAKEEAQAAHLDRMQRNLEEARTKGLITEEQYTTAVNMLAEERKQMEAEAVKATIDNTLSMAGGLTSILDTIADAQDQTTREGFENAKKLQIASATINMLTGITAALSGAFTTHSGPWDIALAAVQAATIAASGIDNIAKISNTQFDGGASTASVSSSAMNATITPATQYAQLNTGAEVSKSVGDTRVYVTEGEITATQKKVSVAQGEARY